MVNSPRTVSSATPLGLESATTELKALFAETGPLRVAPSANSTTLLDPLVNSPLTVPTDEETEFSRSPWHTQLLRGLLGAGAIVLTLTTGFLTGAVIAQRYPQFSPLAGSIAAVTEPPLLEQVFQTLGQQQSRIQFYLKTQFGQSSTALSIDPAVFNQTALNQWDAGELEAKLDDLLLASQSLEAEVTTLEDQLGLASSPGTRRSETALSQRVESLRQALTASASSPSTLPLQITLPTDLLFADGQTTLKPEAADLLANLEASLRADLPSAPTLQITIATHTDAVGNANGNLELSFQRSRSLQMYLAQQLNAPNLTWNAVGYGATRPLADNSIASNRQRNRRVEITLER